MGKKDWIDWLIAALLVFLAPLFIFPSPKWIPFLLVFPVIFGVRGIIKGRLLERSPFDGPILLLLIQIILTCFVIPDILTGFSKITGALFGILIFYSLIALLKTERLLKIGLLTFMGGGALFSIIGFLGMFRFASKNMRLLIFLKDKLPLFNFHLPGAEEGFQPNAVGGSLLFFLPLIYILFFSSLIKRPKRNGVAIIQRKWAIYLYAVVAFVTTSVLILTQSRGSWLALIIGIILIALPLISVGVLGRTFGSLFVVGVIGALIFGYISVTGAHKLPLLTSELTGKLGNRTVLWSLGLETIAKHPWSGIGLNQIRYMPDVGYQTAHLHNYYIHTAAELGVPALCSLLAIMIGVGILCIRTWKVASSLWSRWVALGLGAGQLAYSVFGMTDSISIGTKSSFLFWISLALINCLYDLARNRRGPQK